MRFGIFILTFFISLSASAKTCYEVFAKAADKQFAAETKQELKINALREKLKFIKTIDSEEDLVVAKTLLELQLYKLRRSILDTNSSVNGLVRDFNLLVLEASLTLVHFRGLRNIFKQDQFLFNVTETLQFLIISPKTDLTELARQAGYAVHFNSVDFYDKIASESRTRLQFQIALRYLRDALQQPGGEP